MNLNLIAMLLSLAMMLTGAGGEGQPVPAARNLVLHNVSLSYNGETVNLAPQVRMGVSTDGEKAVFDFGMDLNGEKLFPIQVGVSEEGVTGLLTGSDVAVTVTAKALEGAMEQFNAQLNSVAGEVQNPELMKFLTDEFIPAYTALIRAATDTEQQAQINKACTAIFDEKVQRGEGTPTTVELDGETYNVTAYSYTLENGELAALVDEIYTAAPVLTDYYNALFKLYSMMPEESGLRGIDSFSTLFERFDLGLRMDIEEQRSDDGEVVVTDAVLTMDLSAAAAVPEAEEAVEATEEADEATEEAAEATEEAAEATEEAPEATEEAAEATEEAPEATEEVVEATEEAPEATEEVVEATEEAAGPVMEPIVMNIHVTQIGDFKQSSVDYALETEDMRLEMLITGDQEPGAMDLEMNVNALKDEEKFAAYTMSMFFGEDGEGGNSYSVNSRYIAQDAFKVEAGFYGLRNADGTSENSVSIEGKTLEGSVEGSGIESLAKGATFALSFDLDVTDDAIEDLANGREGALVIDDLSEEALQQQMSESNLFTGKLMVAAGSLQQDAAKLAADESIQKALLLLQGEQLPIDVDDIDEEEQGVELQLGEEDGLTYVVDDEDGEYEYGLEEEEEVVDDGELGFAEPQFTWLPKGWTVTQTNSDTAYDWMELYVADAEGEDGFYALFFTDPDAVTTSYTVAEDGTILEGRGITVTDFGEDGLSVTLRQDEVCGNLMFPSAAIDVETIGKIVAGVKF